jgi:hypothetical protein
MAKTTIIRFNFIIAIVAMFIFYGCGDKIEISQSPQLKTIDSIQGKWVLHHYYLVRDYYFPGPASTQYKHCYPTETEPYKYLTISKDSFFFTNPGKFTKMFPANVLKLSFSGKVNVPQNLERFQYSGYLDKDTLQISFNGQNDLCEIRDSNVIRHLSIDSKYKMVYYLK